MELAMEFGYRSGNSFSITISLYQNIFHTECMFNNNNDNNNLNLYSAISIHKMFKSAAHCHSFIHYNCNQD